MKRKQYQRKPKRKSFIVRRFRSGTFLLGITFISELFILPKKDRYILIGLIFWEVRLGRFYA